MSGLCYVVLLKSERLEIAECAREETFELARLRDAGICAVFERQPEAEAFVQDVAARQGRSGFAIAFSAT